MNHLYEYFYGRDSLNTKLFLAINHATSPFLDTVMPAVSFLGSSRLFLLYFGVMGGLFLARRELMPARYLMVYMLATIATLSAENYLKIFFHVPRPPLALGEEVRLLGHLSRSYALPSGHSVFAFMTATVMSRGHSLRWSVPMFILASLVAYSRIYLGVHYPLDVVAGAIVGSAGGLLSWQIYKTLTREETIRKIWRR